MDNTVNKETKKLRAVKTYGRDTVIVAVNPQEKNSHIIQGKDGPICLFVFTSASEDSRLSEPTSGRYISSTVDYFMDGDIVVFHHNAVLKKDEIHIESDDINSYEKVYGVSLASVFFIIRNGEYIPFWPFCLVKRLYYNDRISKGGIILDSQPVQVPQRLLIDKLPDDERVKEMGVSENDVVCVYEKSDYECCFKKNNKIEHVIRINMERDIMGIDTSMTEEYKKNKSVFFTYKSHKNEI